MPGGPQVPGHLPGTVERRLQELAVDQRHQGEVLGALAPSLMVIARSADRDEPALTGNRQAGVVGPDHRLALSLSVRRPVSAAWLPARISSAQAERRCSPSACPPAPAPAPSALVPRCHCPVGPRPRTE